MSIRRGEINKTLIVLLWLLLLPLILSFFAAYYWVFDLFSHFFLQYFVSAIILALCLVLRKEYKYAGAALVLMLVSFTQARINLEFPFQFSATQTTASVSEENSFKIVQYNHHLGKNNFSDIEKWFTENATNFDIVVLQEATERTVVFADRMRKFFPYQLHEPRPNAFGMVVLSKHPIKEQTIIPLQGPVYINMLIKLVLDLPNIRKPFTLYALHAMPPMGDYSFKQRNVELQKAAKIISQEQYEYSVLIGDWNITPYSPFFSKLIKESNLNYQSTGLFLNPTWPSSNNIPALRIPIDHLLYSKSIRFLDSETAPHFNSDHNAVITTLGLPTIK